MAQMENHQLKTVDVENIELTPRNQLLNEVVFKPRRKRKNRLLLFGGLGFLILVLACVLAYFATKLLASPTTVELSATASTPATHERVNPTTEYKVNEDTRITYKPPQEPHITSTSYSTRIIPPNPKPTSPGTSEGTRDRTTIYEVTSHPLKVETTKKAIRTSGVTMKPTSDDVTTPKIPDATNKVTNYDVITKPTTNYVTTKISQSSTTKITDYDVTTKPNLQNTTVVPLTDDVTTKSKQSDVTTPHVTSPRPHEISTSRGAGETTSQSGGAITTISSHVNVTTSMSGVMTSHAPSDDVATKPLNDVTTKLSTVAMENISNATKVNLDRHVTATNDVTSATTANDVRATTVASDVTLTKITSEVTIASDVTLVTTINDVRSTAVSTDVTSTTTASDVTLTKTTNSDVMIANTTTTSDVTSTMLSTARPTTVVNNVILSTTTTGKTTTTTTVKPRDAILFVPGPFNFNEAEKACSDIGQRMALKHDMENAFEQGYERCTYGWLGDMHAGYVMQKEGARQACGGGIIGLIYTPLKKSNDVVSGVYCSPKAEYEDTADHTVQNNKTVNWWTTLDPADSHTLKNIIQTDQSEDKSLLTSLRIVFPCCNFINVTSNKKNETQLTLRVTKDQMSFLAQAYRESFKGVSLMPHVGVTYAAMLTYTEEIIDELVQTLVTSHVDGMVVDYEPVKDYNREHAEKYRTFLDRLAAKFSPHDLKIGMMTSSWGILKYYDVYASSNCTFIGSMSSTYFGTDLEENEANVEEMATSIEPDRLYIGIGAMHDNSTVGGRDYDWTEGKLNSFLYWLNEKGIVNLHVYPGDWKRLNAFAPYFVNSLRYFISL